MKHLLVLILGLFVASSASAQYDFSKRKTWKANFVNFYYSSSTLKYDDALVGPTGTIYDKDQKNKYGVGFAVGRTFFLHKPIGNCLRFGIEATWLDLNYDHYRLSGEKYPMVHQGGISMGVGASATCQPVKNFSIKGYFQYHPTFMMMYTRYNSVESAKNSENVQEIIGDFHGSYCSMFVAGGTLSYNFVGLGIEARWGKVEYGNCLTPDNIILDTHDKGFRAYLQFKF